MPRPVHTIILNDGTKATRSAERRNYTHALMVTSTEASNAHETERLQEENVRFASPSWDHDRERANGYIARNEERIAALRPGVQSIISWHGSYQNGMKAKSSNAKHFPGCLLTLVEVGADLRPAKVETPAAPKAAKANSWTARLQAVLTGAESITLTAADMAAQGWPASAAKHAAYWGANPAGKAARAAGYTPSLRKVDGAKVLVLTLAA